MIFIIGFLYMAHLELKKKQEACTINTKDWIRWLTKEKQKKCFRQVTHTEVLDEIIVNEFLRVEALLKEEAEKTEARKLSLEEKIELDKNIKQQEIASQLNHKKIRDNVEIGENEKAFLDTIKHGKNK